MERLGNLRLSQLADTLSWLLGLLTLMKQLIMLERLKWQKNKAANIQKGTEVLSPTAHKGPNLANNLISELGSRSFPSRVLR